MQRRRLLLMMSATDESEDEVRPTGPKDKPVAAFSWEDHMRRLSPKDFKARYRLDHAGFLKLLGLIEGDLTCSPKNKARAKASNFGVLPDNRVKLAVALRVLAGAAVLDLQLIYFLASKATVYKYVWAVLDSINKRLVVHFPIDDVDKLGLLEKEFRAASRGAWEGQVMCVDGVHFGTICPSDRDVLNSARYYVGRKSEYAILCMAGCDYARRIMYYDISQAPTTHDSLAFQASEIGARIVNGGLPQPFFVNGDAAFSASNSVITPSGKAQHDDFDFHQSSNRMPIECAFGILVRRWGIFWRKLSMRFDRRAALEYTSL